MPTRPTAPVRDLLDSIRWTMSGQAIEQESFRRIGEECADLARALGPDRWRVARRLIHTTADTGIGAGLVFSEPPLDPVEHGVQALLSGARIVCDSRMIQAGLSLPKLARCHASYTRERLVCRIADEDIVALARARRRTRALCAMERIRELGELEGAIVLVGNAPLALARLCRFILEEDVRPALVVGMPVGFVNVCESKDLLQACPVPYIVLQGRRGGSPLAVATLHALIEVALDRQARAAAGSPAGATTAETASDPGTASASQTPEQTHARRTRHN